MSLPIKPSIEFDNEYVTFLTMEKIKNCLKLLCNSFITRLNSGARIWIGGYTLSHNNALLLARDDGSIILQSLT